MDALQFALDLGLDSEVVDPQHVGVGGELLPLRTECAREKEYEGVCVCVRGRGREREESALQAHCVAFLMSR